MGSIPLGAGSEGCANDNNPKIIREVNNSVGSKSLLLVDDSPEDVQLVLHALRTVVPREDVTICNSGEDALGHLGIRDMHALRGTRVLPRLVVLDLNLPRVTGLDVLRDIRAKAETRLLPVAILSASVEQRDIRAAMQAGANTYVRKSLDYAKLQESMLLLAHYWLELNIQPYA
jgi:two-component system response regulator